MIGAGHPGVAGRLGRLAGDLRPAAQPRGRPLRPNSAALMLVATTDGIVGRDVTETLGLVRGSTVRSKHVGADLVAGLRNIVGGELREYAQLLAGAREQALDRMIEEARTMGADAVVAMRFETSTIRSGASEVIAYGTAVRLAG